MTKFRTKKDIIKNIAIVFLAIMLALTFFSNTIMNWSLPEVSGKYTEYGEIKTGVRGSGVVEANMTYTHSVSGNRTVENVFVSRGSIVEAGTPLMTLSGKGSDEAESLKKEIETLEEAYNRELLTKTEPDYSQDELQLKNAREDLQVLLDERAKYTDEYVAEVKKRAETLEEDYKSAEALVEALTEEIDAIGENSDLPEIVKAREALNEAKKALALAEEGKKEAEEAMAGLSIVDTESLQETVDSLRAQRTALETELKYFQEDHQHLLDIVEALERANAEFTAAEKAQASAQSAYDTALAGGNTEAIDRALTAHNEANTALATATSARDTAKAAYDANKDEDTIKGTQNGITYVERTLASKRAEIKTMDGRISSARSALSTAKKNNSKYTELDYSLELRLAEVEWAKDEVEKKTEALTEAVESISRETAEALKGAKARLAELNEEKTEANEALADLKNMDTLDASIKSEQRSLEQMEMSFEAKKESDARQKALDDYDMAKRYREIQEKRAALAGMQGGGDESYELVAKYPGVVSEVKFRPGEFVTDGAAAVVIEVEQSGYTVSFNVTNAEAQRLNVGDSATVSDTYWGQKLTATLDKISANSDGKTKTLTFNIFGDVETGQSLSLLVGERSTGYSSVIPKSALHEDSEGKFIYITTTKSTPLGNRYVATRLDVKVVASDDKNVAISTDAEWLYEYMIVSSTKPFEEGDYVRLSD